MTRGRFFYIVVFFICVLLSGVAFYYNYVERVPICSLCSLQLMCYYLMALVSLAAFFHDPEKSMHLLYTGLLIVLAGLGALFAGRQLWLQHLAGHQVLACSPNILHLLTQTSLAQAISIVFNRVDSCSMINLRFMGFGMATWSLLFYLIIAAAMVFSALIEMIKPESHELNGAAT